MYPGKKLSVCSLASCLRIDMESVIIPFCLIGTLEEEIMCVDVGERRRVWIRGFYVHTTDPERRFE